MAGPWTPRRKDLVKRVLLRIPPIASLNRHYDWFEPPHTYEPPAFGEMRGDGEPEFVLPLAPPPDSPRGLRTVARYAPAFGSPVGPRAPIYVSQYAPDPLPWDHSGRVAVTLAVELGRILEIPVHHLDTLYWGDTWTPPSAAEWDWPSGSSRRRRRLDHRRKLLEQSAQEARSRRHRCLLGRSTAHLGCTGHETPGTTPLAPGTRRARRLATDVRGQLFRWIWRFPAIIGLTCSSSSRLRLSLARRSSFETGGTFGGSCTAQNRRHRLTDVIEATIGHSDWSPMRNSAVRRMLAQGVPRCIDAPPPGPGDVGADGV